MDVALVLDQVEDRAFDPSQASLHGNLGSLIGTRHRQRDRCLHDTHVLKIPLRPDNPRSKRYCSGASNQMRAEILRSIKQIVQNGQLFCSTCWRLRAATRRIHCS